MTNINLNLYKIFCTVATSKSYSEASEKINLSVPNISTQISNLENQLETKLFNREKDGVKLTEAGKLEDTVIAFFNHFLISFHIRSSTGIFHMFRKVSTFIIH